MRVLGTAGSCYTWYTQSNNNLNTVWWNNNITSVLTNRRTDRCTGGLLFREKYLDVRLYQTGLVGVVWIDAPEWTTGCEGVWIDQLTLMSSCNG